MGVVHLRDVSRAWAGGREVSGMWQGGRKVWAIPTGDALASFYGTGPSQIGLHLQMPGDGPVTSVANVGGDGSNFDAAASGAGLHAEDGYLVCRSDGDVLMLANPLDLVGLHLMWVMTPTSASSAYRFLGSDDTYVRRRANDLQLWDSVHDIVGVPYSASAQSARLYELSMTDSGVTLVVDGAASEHTDWQIPAFVIDRIGQGYNAFQQYDGLFGDMLAVNHGPTADSAIDAARQYMADRYSITLA